MWGELQLLVILGFWFLGFVFVAYRILVPQPGIDPVPPVQWKHRVLTTCNQSQI